MTENELPAVGVIGLGVMGAPMAGHMLRAGFALHVTARRPAQADALVAAGATWQPTARELARHCDVVILMVPDLPDVEHVMHGPDGLLADLYRPSVVVISSTVPPAGVRRLGTRVHERTGGRVRVVDAPVSGGEEGATAGTLAVMVGGTPEDVAVALPVLAATGTAVHLGPLGAGQVAKACNQMVVAATVVALSEAVVVARTGRARRRRAVRPARGRVRGQPRAGGEEAPLRRARPQPLRCSQYMVKDLSFATDEARSTKTATPQLDVL